MVTCSKRLYREKGSILKVKKFERGTLTQTLKIIIDIQSVVGV